MNASFFILIKKPWQMRRGYYFMRSFFATRVVILLFGPLQFEMRSQEDPNDSAAEVYEDEDH
jgi:hypothetical protein